MAVERHAAGAEVMLAHERTIHQEANGERREAASRTMSDVPGGHFTPTRRIALPLASTVLPRVLETQTPPRRAAHKRLITRKTLVAGARFGQYLPIYAVNDIPSRAA